MDGAEVSQHSAGETKLRPDMNEVSNQPFLRLATSLPGLTHGTSALWSEPARPRPVGDPLPTRARTDGNPLDIDQYLRHLSGRQDGAQ